MNAEKIEELNHWYAIYTMPRAEKKVEERMQKNGLTVYLPLVETVRIWSDRKKKVKIPLMAGYVFVKTEEEKLSEIFFIQGTVGYVKYLGKPAKIRSNEIENLRILSTESQLLSSMQQLQINEGETCEIILGSFKGLIGKCVKKQGKHRVVVEFIALGKQFEVNIPITHLELKRNS